MESVSTSTAARESGCSYRQIDYWIRTHAVPTTILMTNLGSGKYRQIPDWYIPRLRLMGEIQKSFGQKNGLRAEELRRIFDAYPNGVLDFGGFQITWKVEE